jgi:hypothetical protein
LRSPPEGGRRARSSLVGGRRARLGPACAAWIAWLGPGAALAGIGNQAPDAGVYGGTLGAGAATAAERSTFGQNPASLCPRQYGAHLHFHRPYGIGDLEVAEAGAFRDGGRWGFSADWRQTGIADLYREQGWGVTQTLRLGGRGRGFPGRLDLGMSQVAWRTEWPAAPAAVDWTWGWGVAWRPLPRLKAGAFALGAPLDPRTDGRTDRIRQFGFEADSRDPEAGGGGGPPGPLQILRLDCRKTDGSPWRTLASLSLSPHPACELTGGVAVPPFQASLGLRLRWGGWECHQALRYHRYLGRTWLSGLSFSRPWGNADPREDRGTRP